MASSKCETANVDQIKLDQHAESSGSTKAAPSVNDVEYAGFWKRLTAAVIDFAVILLVGFGLAIIVPILIGPLVGLPDDIYIVSSVIVFWLIVPWLYYSLTERSSKQGTPGKTAMDIMVTDTEGKRISFGRATKRYWAKVISGMMLLSGFMMIAFTGRKQGLHDIMAQCLVVAKK